MDSNHRAAELTLLVLSTNLRIAPPPKYVVGPSQAPVDVNEAIRLLSKLEKPLECKAAADVGTLRVACRTLTGQERENHRLRAASRVVGLENLVLRRGPDPVDEAVLLLKSPHAELRVPFSTVRLWLIEYVLPHSFSYVPTERSATGVSLTLHVESPEVEVYWIHE